MTAWLVEGAETAPAAAVTALTAGTVSHKHWSADMCVLMTDKRRVMEEY